MKTSSTPPRHWCVVIVHLSCFRWYYSWHAHEG